MKTPAEHTIDTVHEGMQVAFEAPITNATLDAFAELSGDFNPLHMDAEFAKTQGCSDRVLHGAMICALVSRLVGMYCPGRFAVLHVLNMRYHNHTYPGDVLEVAGTVEQVAKKVKTVIIRVTVTNKTRQMTAASGKVQAGFTN